MITINGLHRPFQGAPPPWVALLLSNTIFSPVCVSPVQYKVSNLLFLLTVLAAHCDQLCQPLSNSGCHGFGAG